MNKAVKTASQPLRGRMYNRDYSKPKEHRILVLKTGLAGVQFHIKNDAVQEALDTLQPGTELILYRESDNKYDKWAIVVHLTEDDKLGFITRFKNETIARLMDVGKKFIAVVDDPAEDAGAAEIAEKENRRNRNAATENMEIPFSGYMIEDV